MGIENKKIISVSILFFYILYKILTFIINYFVIFAIIYSKIIRIVL